MNWRMIGIILLVVIVATHLFIFLPHAVLWFFGVYPVPTGTSAMYQLYSGFLPSITVLSLVYPFVNCHVENCARIGRYHVDGYRVCYIHNPNPEVRKRGITHKHVKDVYEDGNNNLTHGVRVKHGQHNYPDHQDPEQRVV